MGSAEGGSGLVEVLLALLLTTVLLLLIGGVLINQRNTLTALTRRVEGAESARLTRDLISHAFAADPSLRVVGGELRVRTFVGSARRCGDGAWGYRGRRLPDPGRDSLWAVRGGGRIQVSALVARRGGSCADEAEGRPLDLVALPVLPEDVVLVRVFEAGRYRVDDALRYGRRGYGAQPLSAAVLDPARSGITRRQDGVSVSVMPTGAESGFERVWTR